MGAAPALPARPALARDDPAAGDPQAGGRRQWAGNRRGRHRARVRPLLHDEAAGAGHGVGTGDRRARRRRPARNDLGRACARRRRRVPCPAADGIGVADAGARAGGTGRPRCRPARHRYRGALGTMRILVVDDEPGLRHTISLILREDGHEVEAAADGATALASLAAADASIVICDVRMPGIDGLAFLDRYRAAEAAIEAIRRGAYDYISKPFRADQLQLVIRKAIERESLRHEVARLSDELDTLRGADGVVGHSAALREVIAVARKVAKHPSTVLVTGESGTGKELIARLVHASSPRASAPFVAVNCAAIPESLMESELFGHARGAFTGAAQDRRGLFEEADGGTIFLDEIGELPLALQVKLLRV